MPPISSRALNLPDRFNAADYFIDRHLREGGAARVAIECAERQVTYAELAESVNRLGSALRRNFQVRMEERVLLLLLDTPEFAFSFFGAIKIGAVPVPVNTLLKPHDYEFLLNDCRARVAIVSESLLPQLLAVPHNRRPFLEYVAVVGEPREDAIAFSQLLASGGTHLPPAPTHKDAAAFWLYSSGSTGAPKGCVHLQHDMVVASELYARQILGVTEVDRFFSVAKLFFAYGLGNALYFPLAVGATSILWPGPPAPEHVYKMIERYRPTLFFSVPSNYAAMLDFSRQGPDFDLSSIRHAVSAGEALPSAIFERFKRRFGVEILDAIGSTEALHMFIANRPGEARPGSSGKIIPGMDAEILDENGNPVPVGEMGNLYIKSDAVCSGYWNQHQKTKETFQGDWLRTGDKYRQDAEGYFWYSGRADDMLKVSGCWVSPKEVEVRLIEHPGIREAAVVARRDKDHLVKPAAYVVLRDGLAPGESMARELQDFVAQGLAVYKRPRWVEFVPELPKTATGKIQRFKLRQLAAAASEPGGESK